MADRLLAAETPPLPGRWQNFQQALSGIGRGIGGYAEKRLTRQQALEDAYMKALMEAQVKRQVRKQDPYQQMLMDYFDRFSKQYGGQRGAIDITGTDLDTGKPVGVGKKQDQPPFVFAPTLTKEGVTLRPIKNPLFKEKKIPEGYKESLNNAIKAIDEGRDPYKVYRKMAVAFPNRSAELKRILVPTQRLGDIDIMGELFGGQK